MSTHKPTSIASMALALLAGFALVTYLLPSPMSSEKPTLQPDSVHSGAQEERSELPPPSTHEITREPDVRAQAATPAAAEVSDVEDAPGASDLAPIGAVLHGTVSSLEGVALAGAYVSMTHSDGKRYQGKTDKRGQYTLGPLPFGRHRIGAGKRDFHAAEQQIEFPTGTSLVGKDFVLRPQQVVRVDLLNSAGEPALLSLHEVGLDLWGLNLVPVATRSDPGETFSGVRGSLNNRFGIGAFWEAGQMGRPALGPATYGTVTLYEDGPAWISLVAAHQVLGKRSIDPSVKQVVFVLDPEDIRQLQSILLARAVAAEDGTPLACTAYLEDDPFPMRAGTDVADDGLIRLEGQLPGERWFILKAPGRAPLVKRVSLVRGQSLDLGDLVLHEPVELVGDVRMPNGDPVEAVLRWGELDPVTQKVSWVQQRYQESKADGSFSIPELTPGTWLVQAQGLPGRRSQRFDPKLSSLSVRVDASLGSVDGIHLVMLETTTITIAVEGATEPWPSVIALDSDGLRTSAAWLGRYGTESQLHLPSGQFELIFRRGGEETERRTLTVGSEPQHIELSYD